MKLPATSYERSSDSTSARRSVSIATLAIEKGFAFGAISFERAFEDFFHALPAFRISLAHSTAITRR